MLFILNKSHEVVGTLNSDGDLSKIVTYFDDSYVQDLGTGAETFQFSTMADTEQAQHLVAGNFVAFKEDGEFKLFSIIQIEETHEETFIKTVYCEMAGTELINEVIRPIKILNSSLRKFLTTILADTEWQLGKIDAGFTQVHDFEITDYKTVYELIQEHAVGTYGAEISYRVEIEHGAVTGKYIDCYAERGKANGFRFAYGSNLTSVVRTVDMSNLATALIGVGNNNITFKEVETGDKPLNQDFIVNETAFDQWNINGNHIFGIHKADTDSPQELLRLTRIALEERANPQIKYEMKAELLGRDIKIGDTVNVIDHEFNPPLYLSARVNQLTKSKTNPYNDEVVLANFKEVNSNITNEMRQLASQLEGYVDSQFPIGGDKIQNGAIGKEQFSKQYHTEIVSDAVYASLVETEELIAGKADIGDLNAVNATIENLKAENVVITGKLEVANAEIENLKAENVEINGSLTANSASIKDLYANKASIEELTATKIDVETLKADKIDVGQLNATKAEIESLVATKADIESLTALYGKIDILESSKANISDLNAVNATIGSLQANKADIVELNAVKGSITQLESEVAKIGTLESDVADIEHILAGNITADNIASGTITAGSGIIADGAIGSAQISDLDASKISAGKIDTSKVEVAGADSHLRIKGNRLQVFQGVGTQAKERVSLGDVNGDGTVYGLRVRGADGQTVLLDENGVTSEGLTDGSITNEKISDDANIDGAKLNINSVVSKINEDGTETIQGTKIEVDGTTLNTKLSTITTKQTEDSERITQAQSQITANTNAIKLKVDEQTYATDKKGTETTLNKHTSEINALKGEISLKVDRTGVEQIVDEVSGELIDSKIDTAKAEIKVTTDAISQNVSNLTQTVSNKADSSTVTTINNKVGSLETSVNGISGKVTNLEKTTTSLGESVEGVQGEVSTLKSDVASLEVTTSGISQKVSSVESTTASLTTQVGTANTNATNALNKADSASALANSVDGKVTTLQGEYNTTKSKVASLETNLDGITQRVSSTESTTVTLTEKVGTAQSTADSAKTTATNAQSTANTAKNTADTAIKEISTTNSKVSSIETNLSGITSRVSSVESKTTTIDGKVTALDTRMSSAEQKITDSAIISTVTSTIEQKVDEGIKNINLGGNNILRCSNFENNNTLTEWVALSGSITEGYLGKNAVNIDNSTATSGYVDKLRQIIHDGSTKILEGEQWYTFSFYAKGSGKVRTHIYPSIIDSNVKGFIDSTEVSLSSDGNKDWTLTDTWTRHTYTFKAKASIPSVEQAVLFRVYYGNNVYICMPQLEKGNKASDWSLSIDDIEKSISETEKVLNNNIDSAIGTATEDIYNNIGENYTTKDEFKSMSESFSSQLEQTSKDITATFETTQNYTKEVDGKLQNFQDTVSTHIRFSEDGIDLGKTNSPFTATLDNTQLAFKQDGQTVAYISNNKMHITQAEIKDSLRIGDATDGFFTWEHGANGNLSLKWSDK